jgi:glycine cleavage system H protein
LKSFPLPSAQNGWGWQKTAEISGGSPSGALINGKRPGKQGLWPSTAKVHMSKNVVPDELYYSAHHEWALVDENLVTVGLTGYGLDQLGEVLYLDFPEEGKNVTREGFFLSIESTKKIHDMISPVRGTIIEVNQSLFESPGLLNDDPFNQGWIVKIEMDDEKDLASLMRANAYRTLIGLRAEKETAAPEPIAAPKNLSAFSDDEDEDDDEDDADDGEE